MRFDHYVANLRFSQGLVGLEGMDIYRIINNNSGNECSLELRNSEITYPEVYSNSQKRPNVTLARHTLQSLTWLKYRKSLKSFMRRDM